MLPHLLFPARRGNKLDQPCYETLALLGYGGWVRTAVVRIYQSIVSDTDLVPAKLAGLDDE